MTQWLDAEDLLTLLAQHTGPDTRILDAGILYAIAMRPRATMIDEAVYPTSVEQAAALLHGIVSWKPLSLWNAGLGWAAARVHLDTHGFGLAMPPEERMKLTDELQSGRVQTVEEITLRISKHLVPLS